MWFKDNAYLEFYYLCHENMSKSEEYSNDESFDGSGSDATYDSESTASLHTKKPASAKPVVENKAKPEVKPEVKSEVKPEVKPEIKPEVKPEVKPVKQDVKPVKQDPKLQFITVLCQKNPGFPKEQANNLYETILGDFDPKKRLLSQLYELNVFLSQFSGKKHIDVNNAYSDVKNSVSEIQAQNVLLRLLGKPRLETSKNMSFRN